MGWKQDFVEHLRGSGFEVDESMIGSAEHVRDDLRQLADWYAHLDDVTKHVLNFVDNVGAGLHFAGFGQRWPGLVTLLGQSGQSFQLRDRYNSISHIWNELADRAVHEDTYSGL